MHLPAVGVAIRVWKLGAKAFGYREQSPLTVSRATAPISRGKSRHKINYIKFICC